MGAGSSGSSGDDTSTTEAASDADFSPSDSDGGGGGGGGVRYAAMEALFPGLAICMLLGKSVAIFCHTHSVVLKSET